MKDLEIFKTYGMYSTEELKSMEDVERDYLENWEDTENGEYSDQNITDRIYDSINLQYEDEECLLNKELDGRVIAIADLGLWYGRRTGYKILSRNLNSILDSIACDEFRVYADRYNVRAEGYHHDGHHYIEYRELREDRNYQILLDKLYSQEEVSRQEINYYTRSLRGRVREIYGR
jgi:hypothetical protein